MLERILGHITSEELPTVKIGLDNLVSLLRDSLEEDIPMLKSFA